MHKLHRKHKLLKKSIALIPLFGAKFKSVKFQKDEVQVGRQDLRVMLIAQFVSADVPIFQSSFVFMGETEINKADYIYGLKGVVHTESLPLFFHYRQF